jgi:signal transduction histidine kinase
VALDGFLVLLAAGEAASVLAGHAAGKPLAAAVSALSALVLIGRRRQPLAASIAAFALTALAITAVVPITTPQFFGILATFAVTGSINAEREAVVAWLAGALMLAYGTWHAGGPGRASDYALTLAFATTLWAAGMLVRRRTRDTRAAVLRAEAAERDRQEQARRAVREERARIARELHDVIAHHVSMIVLQAGAERRVLSEENASTREVLETVEQSGRSALTEMRRLLGMLRGDANEPLSPQPGLGDVPTLVGQLRDAGLPVELSIDGERRELPVGIELSAYRIVQEALTNALKYAGDAHATVRVRYGADSLELEIVDDGPGDSRRASGGGHGLVGMRERVALYGGRFDARRDPGGGFAVRVVLPIR